MRSTVTRAIIGTLIVVLGLSLTFILDSNRSLAMNSLLEEPGTALGQSHTFFYAFRPAPDDALYLSADAQGWRELRVAFAGEVRAVAATTPTSDAVYVATTEGLYATADGGKHWTLATHELEGAVMLLAPALPVEDMVYAVTDEGALWKLTDGGRSAMRVTGANLPASVTALVPNPTNPNQLYAATNEGLWVSDTMGEQWERVQDLPATTSLQFDAADPRILYVTTPADGFFRSTDSGGTWQPANEGLTASPDAPLAVTALVQDRAHPTTLYVATSTAIFTSEDGGAQWLPVAEIAPNDLPIATLIPEPGPGAGVRAPTASGLRAYRLDPDAALALLQSDDPATRLQGIKTLSIAAVPTQAASVLPYIHDADGQIGYYAARALGRMGGEAVTREMVTLIEGDAEAIVKHRALLALQLIADEATLPTLTRAFEDEDLARTAADALAAVGTDDAWGVLTRALDAPGESLQRQAALAAFEANSPRAVQHLLAQLAHEDATIRANAAEALGWSKSPQAVEPLRALLDDPDAVVRASTALALGLLGDGASLNRLTTLSQSDPSPEVRAAAAQSLTALQGLIAPVAPADHTLTPPPNPVQAVNWIPWFQAFILVSTAVLGFLAFAGVPKPSVASTP